MLKESDKVGAVMVVGSGIAGIQASLDLANSGMKVFLVERGISIGGVMAQLDKTFPTNDCSACILSPKLVEVGRHPNVEIMTGRTVEAVEGEAGRFRVRLTKAPRYIDLDKCTGCGDCANVCPVSVPSDFNEALNTRKAVYRHFPQAIPSGFAIDKLGTSPCKAACPDPHQRPGVRGPDRGGKVQGSPETHQEGQPLSHRLRTGLQPPLRGGLQARRGG